MHDKENNASIVPIPSYILAQQVHCKQDLDTYTYLSASRILFPVAVLMLAPVPYCTSARTSMHVPAAMGRLVPQNGLDPAQCVASIGFPVGRCPIPKVVCKKPLEMPGGPAPSSKITC